MNWILVTSAILLAIAGLLTVGWWVFFYHVKRHYYDKVVRIFQEQPLFIIPRGEPVEDAEEVTFQTSDGLGLRGCYLPTPHAERRGVILFGLEFGSNRWAGVPYCAFLRDAGYDIFTFEPRSQGDSEKQPDYEPLQWVTTYEVRDTQAAIAYLKSRPDSDPNGIGLFAISKGAGAGLLAAAEDNYVRCFVTDGLFDIFTTMMPYMLKWILIYTKFKRTAMAIPEWYYAIFARMAIRQTEGERQCRFAYLAPQLSRLAPRPLLMIHGQRDTYIKPEMAEALYKKAIQPKELWLVPQAKHNQSFQVATEEYQRRVLEFFDLHLQTQPAGHIRSANGLCVKRQQPARVPAVQS